jgi:hypothetical protein
MSNGLLLLCGLGCARAWLAFFVLQLYMAQGECTSVFSVVLLV